MRAQFTLLIQISQMRCPSRIWLCLFWLLSIPLVNPAMGAEFSVVEISGKPVTICRVNVRKEPLHLFYRDDEGQPFKRFDRLSAWLKARGQRLVFAMNAGMYHGDFSAMASAFLRRMWQSLRSAKHLSISTNLLPCFGTSYIARMRSFLTDRYRAFILSNSTGAIFGWI